MFLGYFANEQCKHGKFKILLKTLIRQKMCSCECFMYHVYSLTCPSCAGACGRAGHTVPPCQSSELSDSLLSPRGVASPEPAALSHSYTHTLTHTSTVNTDVTTENVPHQCTMYHKAIQYSKVLKISLSKIIPLKWL